jgi:hypothetical protein
MIKGQGQGAVEVDQVLSFPVGVRADGTSRFKPSRKTGIVAQSYFNGDCYNKLTVDDLTADELEVLERIKDRVFGQA